MIKTLIADLSSNNHGRDIVRLLDAYASDVMGGGQPLSDYTKANLISELSKRDRCVAVLTYVEDEAAALAICFEGFSTFACRPILNIHDITVHPDFRGRGLSVEIMKKVEEQAVKRGCCKITLEVLEGNNRASKIYRKFGFRPYELDAQMGRAIFYEKKL